MEKTIYYFANNPDYKDFVNFLKQQDVILVDTKPRIEKGLKIIENIFDSELSEVILLNTKIHSIADYESNFIQNVGYYNYTKCGHGIIQLLRSKIFKGNLMHGRLFASFTSDDFQSKKFANDVFKWVKSNGKKVYRTTSNMRVVAEKAEKGFYSLPNSAKEFNGTHGQFLTIGEGIYCVTME